MENLESILPEIQTEIQKEDKRPMPIEYKGLKLLEDKRYAGGTSIKYWM